MHLIEMRWNSELTVVLSCLATPWPIRFWQWFVFYWLAYACSFTANLQALVVASSSVPAAYGQAAVPVWLRKDMSIPVLREDPIVLPTFSRLGLSIGSPLPATLRHRSSKWPPIVPTGAAQARPAGATLGIPFDLHRCTPLLAPFFVLAYVFTVSSQRILSLCGSRVISVPI